MYSLIHESLAIPSTYKEEQELSLSGSVWYNRAGLPVCGTVILAVTLKQLLSHPWPGVADPVFLKDCRSPVWCLHLSSLLSPKLGILLLFFTGLRGGGKRQPYNVFVLFDPYLVSILHVRANSEKKTCS